jgi:hypothetical protein
MVALSDVAVSGGTLKTSAGGDITFFGAGNLLKGAAIGSGATVSVATGAALTLSGGTISSGATLDVASGGTVVVSGTTANSGTLYASGSGSVIEIAGGAVVNGGTTEVGDGKVEIAGASKENVSFLSNGSGILQLNSAATYTGKVSNFGFGTSAHNGHNEQIDLTAITYSTGVVSETYSGGTASGVLKVVSGATTVATISMTGAYVTSNFTLAAGSGGSGTIITDPSGVTVQGPNVALFGNYIAGSFVTAGGQGGTVISHSAQGEQPLLTHPHT